MRFTLSCSGISGAGTMYEGKGFVAKQKDILVEQ